jgi:hypothetical protein
VLNGISRMLTFKSMQTMTISRRTREVYSTAPRCVQLLLAASRANTGAEQSAPEYPVRGPALIVYLNRTIRVVAMCLTDVVTYEGKDVTAASLMSRC